MVWRYRTLLKSFDYAEYYLIGLGILPIIIAELTPTPMVTACKLPWKKLFPCAWLVIPLDIKPTAVPMRIELSPQGSTLDMGCRITKAPSGVREKLYFLI